MKALHERLIVKVDLEQKNRHGILFLQKQYNQDGKEANPVVCEVINVNSDKYPYLQAGDKLIVHHNYFEEVKGTNVYLIEKTYPTATYCIPANPNIYARLREGEVEPVCENMICERILQPLPSSILVIPDSAIKHYNDRVVVLKTAPEVGGIKAGDTVAIYKWADTEICFNLNGRETRFIKVHKEDVFGIINKQHEHQTH